MNDMTFDEFKIRVNDFKMKLEYTNENTLTKDLFELNNLIESIKDEPFYNPRCGSAIKNEIKDMDSYEYGINGKMCKSENHSSSSEPTQYHFPPIITQ